MEASTEEAFLIFSRTVCLRGGVHSFLQKYGQSRFIVVMRMSVVMKCVANMRFREGSHSCLPQTNAFLGKRRLRFPCHIHHAIATMMWTTIDTVVRSVNKLDARPYITFARDWWAKHN